MSIDIPPNYRPLAAPALADYFASLPALSQRLGGGPEQWRFNEVSDGYLNIVHLVDGPSGSLCAKQALPHVRQDKNWPLPLDRSAAENVYWQTVGPHVSGLIPEIYHYDPDFALIVMEKLAPHQVLRGRIVAGEIYHGVGARVAEYVARTAFFTSDLHQKQEFKHQGIAALKGNHVLHRIMLELVFQDPFIDSPRNRWTRPQLDDVVATFRTDPRIRIAAGRLAHRFLSNPQALVHNDLHAGAVMLTHDDLRIIDPEFATYGPIGVDLGIFIGHLLIGYFAQDGYGEKPGERAAQQQWLLGEIVAFWTAFRRRFLELWRDHGAGDAYLAQGFTDVIGAAALEAERERFVDELFADAIGFAGPSIVRALVGYSQFAETLSIDDPDRKAAVEAGALSLARDLLLYPERYNTIADVVAAAPRHRRAPTGKQTTWAD